jgi:hypothetical protein
MAIRDGICAGVADAVVGIDVTSNEIFTRARAVSLALDDMSAVSTEGFLMCARALTETVSGYAVMAADDDTIHTVMDAFSAVLSRGYPLPGNVLDEVSAALSDLSMGRQQVMAVGEDATSITTPHVRLFVSKARTETALALRNDTEVRLPSSPLEQHLGIIPATLSMGVVEETTGDLTDVTGFSSVVYNYNVDGIEVNSSKLRLEYHAYGAPHVIDTLTVHARNWLPETYDSRPLVKHSIDCVIRANGSYNVNSTDIGQCVHGGSFAHTCPGSLQGRFDFFCSGYERLPVCMLRAGASNADPFAATDSCEVVDYDGDFSSCACALSAADLSARTTTVANAHHVTVDMAISSFVFKLTQDTNYTQQPAYQPPPPPKALLPVLCLAAVILVSVMMAFGLGEFDWSYYDGVYVPGRAEERAQKEREVLQAAVEAKARRKMQRHHTARDHSDASDAPRAPIPGSGSNVHVHHHKHHKKKDDGVAYPAHNGLPDEFLDARWSERFKRVLTRHYMYWGVVSFRRGDEYDLLLSTRWLCLASRLLGVVLGASGAAFVYFADDGSCELLRSQDTCLASTMTSLPLLDNPMCQWVYSQEYCVFIEPETSALAVVVVAMFGALGNLFSAATEFGIRRLDEYVRVWLKHRVVEYDAEKKAATAYAIKLVGDFELGLAEEVRQERDARKFKNYEDNVEFDPDYDPRNEPAPWEPGGMGVQILIDFEIRKKKEAAELQARLKEEARLAAIEAERASLSREVDATCASAKNKELDPETDAAVAAARAALLAFNAATAASEEARALAIAEAAKPKPKWDYSVVVNNVNGTPSDTPSVNEDGDGDGDGDGEGVEVVVEEEMQVEEVKDEDEAAADLDDGGGGGGGGDGDGDGDGGEESKKKEKKVKKEKSRKKKKKKKDKGPAPVGLPGDDDDDEEPDPDAPVVADTGMSYQALDPMFAKMAKKLQQSEFAKLATTRYKWMIAAKLVKMQANIDYISSLSEAHSVENAKQFLLVRNSRALQPEHATLFKRYEAIGVVERILIGWKLQLDVQGNAISAAQLLHAESLPLVLSKVRWSRSTASSLVEWMMHLPLASQRESFLMNMFLVRSLDGYQQRIAYRLMKMYVPGNVPDSLRHEPERFVHMFLFPLLCLPLCIACLVFMLPLGQRAVALWGAGLITGLIFDMFLFHPCMLWLKFIVAPSMARNEIVKLHGLLQYRARFLMTRVRGQMLSFSSLVQHFNPACRAARMVPDLHTSRLLIGLHDYDLSWPGFANGGRSVKYRTENRSMYVKKSIAPVPQTPVAIALHTLYYALHPRTYRRILLLLLELALTVYSLLPDVAQDAMMEVGAVLLGGGVAISICYFEKYRFLAIVGLLVLIAFFLVVDMFIGDHTHHVVRSLRNHHYIRSHREGGDDGSSMGAMSKTNRSFGGGGGGSRRGALRRKSGAAVVPTNGTGDGDFPDDFTDISTSPRFNTDGPDEPSAALNGTSGGLSMDTGGSPRR